MTLADERTLGLRPYLRHIRAENVIWWWSERFNGREILTEVRIKERVRVREGVSEDWKDRVRVLKIGTWELWEQQQQNNKAVWVKIEEGLSSFQYGIPWVTLYTGREGFMVAKPPMLDLAHLNISHWQSSSDQRNILRVARVPFLFASGFKEEDSDNVVTISVARAVRASDPQSNLRWVEHTGACIAAGERDLQTLKEEMAVLGLELLVRKPIESTATADTIDKAEMDSQLSAMALALQDTLINCYQVMGLWVGLSVDLPIQVNMDFGLTPANATALGALQTARMNGDISRPTFWMELKRYGVLSDAFDPEIEEALLANEFVPALPGEGLPPDETPPPGEGE
jgi:hypothetical protein